MGALMFLTSKFMLLTTKIMSLKGILHSALPALFHTIMI